MALDVLAQLPKENKSIRIGVTGTPGAGKSTFIDAFGSHLLKQQPKAKLAVLTVDPSSEVSRGSILGDKTRMNVLSNHPRAFIRPTASGNQAGGLSHNTRLAMLLCEAAGFDHIFIESVGVGQGETEISKLSDLFLLLLNPGGGDELQGIKRGIVEMADLLVVNKADGDHKAAATQTAKDYSMAQHLMPENENGWKPRVLLCSALNNEGMEQVAESVNAFFEHLGHDGVNNKRLEQQKYWVYRHLQDLLFREIRVNDNDIRKALDQGMIPEQIAEKLKDRLLHPDGRD